MQKTFRKWQKTSKNNIININNRNYPSPTKFPHFRKNIQNSFQEGCKPDTCQPRVSDSEPWDLGPEYGMKKRITDERIDEQSMNEMTDEIMDEYVVIRR